MARGQRLSKSHTVPSSFGVFYGHGFEGTLGPVLVSQLTSPERKTQGFTKAFHKVPQHRSFYSKDIFFVLPYAGTWNTASKTQEKDWVGKLRDVSNTAHTPVLPLHPLPSCQKHQAPLLSYVTAVKDFHVRSLQCTSISTEIIEEIIRTNL